MSVRAVKNLSVENPVLKIIPFTVAEQTEQDTPLTQAQIDALQQIIANEVMEIIGPIRALALTMLSEINILRSAAGLAPRTVQQLKDAVFDNSA